MKLAENAHQIRTQKELTIREVAHTSGLSVGAIHAIENAKGSPRVSTLERLADGLGTTVTQLLREASPRGGGEGQAPGDRVHLLDPSPSGAGSEEDR